jgi:hypothetical protein
MDTDLRRRTFCFFVWRSVQLKKEKAAQKKQKSSSPHIRNDRWNKNSAFALIKQVFL